MADVKAADVESKRPMFGVKWPMFGLKRPMYHRLLLWPKAADAKRVKVADVYILLVSGM